LPGRERQCLDFIIRRTYGWQKKEAEIPIKDFVSATGIGKTHVSSALKSLRRKRLIVTKNGNTEIKTGKNSGRSILTYSFNKYFEQWAGLCVTENGNIACVTENGNTKLPKTVTQNTENGNTKDFAPIIVKDNIKTIKDKLHTSKKNGVKKTAKKSNDFYKKKALAVLKYFNKMKGSKYRDHAKISARLKDGGTVKDCILIINNKFADEYFQENPRFLNPTTLFRKSHWDKYLNDIPVRKISKSTRTQYNNARVSEDWLNGK
jgi:phage replication O-like protein O